VLVVHGTADDLDEVGAGLELELELDLAGVLEELAGMLEDELELGGTLDELEEPAPGLLMPNWVLYWYWPVPSTMSWRP
jgi:hypothetical protein